MRLVVKKNFIPKAVFDITEALKSGMSKSEILKRIDEYKTFGGDQWPQLEKMNGNPSLDKLLSKGRINELQYQALCTGDKNDILLAFNLELFEDCDNYVNAILIKKSLEDK